MADLIRMEGMVFGELTVIRKAGTLRKYAAWLCRCSCGAEIVVRGDKLRRGDRKVCDYAKHSDSFSGGPLAKEDPLTFSSWRHMQARCRAKTGKHHKNYVLRGITVCERWRSFAAFLEDMGPRGSAEMTIERIDNDGPYAPGNCRWATNFEQQRNRSTTVFVEWGGEKRVLVDVCAEEEAPYAVVSGRLRMGWPLEEAVGTPIRARKKNRPKEIDIFS
jgi:hypothetical protein